MSNVNDVAESEPQPHLFISLRGGLLVSADAIALAVSLEMRGHVISKRDDALLVTNGAALTTEDRVQIKALKRHLLAIVGYQAPQ